MNDGDIMSIDNEQGSVSKMPDNQKLQDVDPTPKEERGSQKSDIVDPLRLSPVGYAFEGIEIKIEGPTHPDFDEEF